MNQKLRLLSYTFLMAFALAMLPNHSRASHYQASELTYINLAPGMYQVTLVLYRDCSGASLGTSESMKIQSLGCNTGRNITLNQVTNPSGVLPFGNPYCGAQTQAPCTTASPPNYEVRTYKNTVTFSAVEQVCPNWLMSVRLGNRPTIENLVNAQSTWLYTEAYVNLAAGIHNNSPEFGHIGTAVPYLVTYGSLMTCSMNATEPDGDSIVYSLSSALDDYNSPIPYAQVNIGPFIVNQNPAAPFNTTTNKQYASVPATPAAYSASFPMPSYDIDWNTPNQIVPSSSVIPYFDLDPQTGSLSFIPAVYHPNTPSAQGRNKYVIAVQADEYRKINGVDVKVGHIRRDMLVTIVECGPNQNPRLSTLTANNAAIPATTMINLRPGTPLNLQFDAQDQNTSDVVQMYSNVDQILPGATFAKTTAAMPTGTVTWTPTAADLGTHYFTVSLYDNACPAKGQHTRTIGVRVSQNGSVTGIANESISEIGFTAYPNPFGQQTKFRINLNKATTMQQILIYNVLGQQVDEISLKNMQAGEQHIEWLNAHKQPAGQYAAKLIGENKTLQTIKFTKLN